MTVPYREWYQFEFLGFYGEITAGDFTVIGAWQDISYPNGWIGYYRQSTPNLLKYWKSVYRPTQDFSYDANLSSLLDIAFRYQLTQESASSITDFAIKAGLIPLPADPAVWEMLTATGKYYNGVNSWGNFPPATVNIYTDAKTITIATDDIVEFESWQCSYHGVPGLVSYAYQDEFFNNGVSLGISSLNGVIPYSFMYNVKPLKIIARFHDPVVNELSRNVFKTAGGQTLVLTGIGFSLTDAECSDITKYTGNANPPGGWNSLVDRITFEGQQGQGNYVLNRAAGDFTVDSDSQITIALMPAMAMGTYKIKIEKIDVANAAFDTSCYAGAWFAEADGRCYRNSSSEFVVLVDDYFVYPPSPRHRRTGGERTGTGAESIQDAGPILLTTWSFRDAEGNEILKNIAPIDTRSTDRFYEGLMLSNSGFSRSLTGEISDMNIDLSNHNKWLSIIRANYECMNQLVDIFHAWKNEPEVWKQHIMTMIVADYSPEGVQVPVILKDITQKYFRKKIPFYRITADDYPTAPESSLGQVIPEILGLNYLNTSECKGACQAYRVSDKSYVGAAGSLHSVTEVYSDGVLKATPGDYSIAYRDGGRTYIDFVVSQGDNKITFNCKGYMFVPWNSANGCVENPAYILAFVQAFFARIPGSLLNFLSFDDIADMFDTLGYGESGRLIIDKETDCSIILDELYETFDYQGFIANDGRFKLGKKSAADIDTDRFLFEQIDIFDHAKRDEGFSETINYIKAKFDFYPTHDLYNGEDSGEHPGSITLLGSDIERDREVIFKWTNSAALVAQRINDELLKHAYGYKKISFQIPMVWINDIDLYDNFYYQDPYGISATGGGEVQGLYYIEKLDYDFMNQKIGVIAVDMDWLLRQYFIFCDELTLPSLRQNATYYQRRWGYMCDEITGAFSDGWPGKIMIDENLL